jgi:hypothetical protein
MRHTVSRAAPVHVHYQRDAFVAAVHEVWLRVGPRAETLAWYLLAVCFWGTLAYVALRSGF